MPKGNLTVTVNIANCESIVDMLEAFKIVLSVVGEHPQVEREVMNELAKLALTKPVIKTMFDL